MEQVNTYLTNVFITDFNKRFAIDYRSVDSVLEENPSD